jgi:hypothetical protein
MYPPRLLGFLVLSPDYFHASELTSDKKAPEFDLRTWIAQWRTTTQDSTGSDVQRTSLLLREWVEEMKRVFGREESRYGIVGEPWHGWRVAVSSGGHGGKNS